MSEEPTGFWGKLAMITAFLSALAGLGAVVTKCSDTPPIVISDPSKTNLDPYKFLFSPPQAQVGNFCCDISGIRRCQLLVPTTVGSSCVCFGQGGGISCP